MQILDWLSNLWTGNKSNTTAARMAEDSEVDLFNPFPEPVEIAISDVIDLHTIPPRDVKSVVEEYLRLAHEAGFESVRIIHGKGIGVQRKMVRKILAQTSFVANFVDAPPEAGGLGATVVHLRMEAE